MTAELKYFAGEATAKDWGTVAGANDSGIETAKNLMMG